MCGRFGTQSGGHDRCDLRAGRALSELTAVGQLAGRSQTSPQHGLAGISPWAVGEELCHEEWLGQEPLNLPRSVYHETVFLEFHGLPQLLLGSAEYTHEASGALVLTGREAILLGLLSVLL